jgi:CRISPR-associated endonuclease/helicase Cas3
MFYAHSTSDTTRRDWQPLSEHAQAVGELAAAYGKPLGLGNIARLAGLLHDLGKYTEAFQLRLTGASIRVDHSTAGAALVRSIGIDRYVADLLGYVIAGHHAGLPDRLGGAGSLEERLRDFDASTLDSAWQREITLDAQGLAPKLDFTDKAKLPFQFGFLGRMIFSCLVDADYRDTEAFYHAVEGRNVQRDWPQLQSILPALIPALERHLAALGGGENPINALRRDILEHVRARAADPKGLFTLTVPTGGGKTLASLAFALDHARQHGLGRVIYAIPFTSIIDQTAAVFRQVLGADHVLEHHSAIEEQDFVERRGRDKLRLAMEDWAAPVVVTTNVQLFESLFAARPGSARKLHNIANSVIILDEAQTLPRSLLAPCVRVIDELAHNYGCTIVLCTATQPALDQRNFPKDHPMGLPLAGRELAPDPPRLAAALRRTTIRQTGAMDNSQLVDALGANPQGLIIVNSRKHALELFRAAGEAGLEGLVHLTTRQYPAHRREILAAIKERLREKQPCRVIATSLVEAGVDVDFPLVWRAEAGLDQIAQTAGRCNREGRRPAEASIVTIFSAPDYPPPAEIKGLTGDMARMVAKHDDLLSPAAIEDFFGEVYWRLGDALDRKQILSRFQMDRTGTNFSYRSVAEDFRMVESGMAPVIVARDADAERAVRELSIPAIPSGAIARKLQIYTVQVPPNARKLLLANGHVRFLEEKLRADQFAVLQTPGLYSEEAGLLWENADYVALENSII